MVENITFKNRFDSDYRNVIINKLSLTHKDSLVNSAIPIKEETIDGSKYDKLINIDFLGISSSLFFDKGGNHNSLNQKTSEAFDAFLSKLEEINKLGIKVRLRLLLVYPYSDYAFSRIQAECDTNRSSVTEKKFIRNFHLVEKINEDTFIGSIYYQNQVDSLLRIEHHLKNNSLLNKNSPNSIRIRFTPLGTSLCVLRLNNDFYYDPYIYSKQKKYEKKLLVGFPLINVNSETNNDDFESLEDHFRYIWTLDSTLYCEDATFFDSERIKGLNKIKKPKQISFDAKADRLKSIMEKNKEEPASENAILRWKLILNDKIKLSTQNFTKSPERETVFITCSWKADKKGRPNPNKYALKLEEWLNIDFSLEKGRKLIDTKLVKAKVGDSLSNSIYTNLDESSLALIIMTKDYVHQSKGYCKPNIYHELGYLMKQIEDKQRLAVLIEENVEIPSNFNDIVYLGKFNKSNFEKKYFDILNWFKTSESYIGHSNIERAVVNHKIRIN